MSEKIFVASEQSVKDNADKLDFVVAAQLAAGADLTSDALWEAYFAPKKNGKIYGVRKYRHATSSSTAMVKLLANTGLVAVPSIGGSIENGVDEFIGQDDYLEIGLFQYLTVNYTRNDNGDPIPCGVKDFGISYHESGAYDVGSMGMRFYVRVVETDTYRDLYWSDTKHPGFTVWYGCKRKDGTEAPYWIYPQFFSGIASDGFLRSQPDLAVARNQSYTNMITNYAKKGTGYHGAGDDRNVMQIMLFAMKYGTASSQSVMAGRTSKYTMQQLSVVDTAAAHNYVVVSNANAAAWYVGETITGTYGATSPTDRGSVSIFDSAKITGKEAYDGSNMKLILDCAAFTLAPPTGNNCYIMSAHSRAGETAPVPGHHDGSFLSNTNSQHPYRLMGMEFAPGIAFISSSKVMYNNADFTRTVYACPKGTARSTDGTAIKANYKTVGTIPANSADWWIGDIVIDPDTGTFYPDTIGDSDSHDYGDRCWGAASVEGWRECYENGYLSFGASAGAAASNCNYGLTNTDWTCGSCD